MHLSAEGQVSNRLRGTTALGAVLCSVGAVLLLLISLVGIALLLQPELLAKEPSMALSLSLNLLSRLMVVVTGIAVLRRSQRSIALAVVGIGVIIVAGACDVLLFAVDPASNRRSILIGSVIALGFLASLLVVTILYLRRRQVRDEFQGAPVASAAGA